MICLSWILMGIYLKCILSGILCEGSCGERKHVDGAQGGDVLLQVDPVGVIGDITWFIGGNHFATTESGKNIQIRDNRYKGKLYSTEDGSLLMKNVVGKDQGTYIASTVKSTAGKEEFCALIYDLRIYAMLSDEDLQIEHEVFYNETCNVTFNCTMGGSGVTITWESSTGNDRNVTSNVIYVQNPDPKVIYTCTSRSPITRVSKSVTPWEYCKKGRQEKSEGYTVINIIRLNVAGCILIIAGLIFGHHLKKEVVVSSGDNG